MKRRHLDVSFNDNDYRVYADGTIYRVVRGSNRKVTDRQEQYAVKMQVWMEHTKEGRAAREKAQDEFIYGGGDG